jgi:hypothetical protein
MKITDHGQWEVYEPETAPAFLRAHKVMFCRRVSDKRDWYEFQHELGKDTIKMVVDADGTVQATQREASMLFPGGRLLLEVYEANIDHETLRQKVFNGTEFMPMRPPENIGKLQLLATLKEFGLDEEDLQQLRKAKEQRR